MVAKENDEVTNDSTNDSLRKANHSDADGVHSSAVAAIVPFS